MLNGKDASLMKFVFVAALSVVLMACKADSPASSVGSDGETGVDSETGADSGAGVGPDNNVQVVTDSGSAGSLRLSEPDASEESGLRELNTVSLSESDTLFDGIETIPEIAVIQSLVSDGENRGGIPTDVSSGTFIALNPFTQVVFGLAQRDGFVELSGSRVERLNNNVRQALTPEVTNLYSGRGALSELPESEEGSLGLSDPELILLYRLGIEAIAANEGMEGEDVTVPEEREDEPRLSVLLDDLASGVVSGFDRNGLELTGLPYNPLPFEGRYDTALNAFAGEFGNEELQELIADQSFTRFISRDSRCDGERVINYFGQQADTVELDVREETGRFEGETSDPQSFNLAGAESGTGVGITTEIGGTEISVGEDDLFTCSLNENSDGELIGLVRFVTELENEEGEQEPHEVTLVDDGDDELGIYIASDSGDELAAFGDVNPRGGWRNPDDGDGENTTACGVSTETYEYFGNAGGGDVVADSDTQPVASVDNPGRVVDTDASTASLLSVEFGLAGIGQAEVSATLEEGTIDPGENGEAAALIAVPDSAANLNLFENATLATYLDGEEQSSTTNLNLLDVDLGGIFNDDSIKRVVVETGGEAFDEIRFRINSGVLSADIRTQVFEFCHGTAGEDTSS